MRFQELKIYIVFVLLGIVFFLSSQPILAAGSYGLDEAGKEAGLSTNLTVYDIAGQIIQYALSTVGAIFLILIIYGGFQWMTAAGNEEQVKKAKALMYNAAIGVIIVLAAYTITYFVIDILLSGTQKEETVKQPTTVSSLGPTRLV